jgi:signal transduction histidine kinase
MQFFETNPQPSIPAFSPTASVASEILVVDDTPANLRLLVQLLTEQKYKVRPCPNGKLAIAGVTLSVPDLILLDINMPDMNGYEVCEQLKANPQTCQIPVIFISALGETLDKVKAFAVGGVDYITKPFQAEEVLARVNTHLRIHHLQLQLEQINSQQADQLSQQNLQLQAVNHALTESNQTLTTQYEQLQQTQLQLVQNEKLASLGNLVAGVAHEINNPIGFLNGSIGNATEYVQDILSYIDLYQHHHPDPAAPVQEKAEEIDLVFLSEDLTNLLNSMRGAVDRIKAISTSLRVFSRADTDYKVSANLHEGIDSTLLILKYRLKANKHRPEIQVIQNYGDLPIVECFPGQLNQVFMNILANAIDMFDEMSRDQSFSKQKAISQQIKIHTAVVANQIQIQIRDNGQGMPEDVKTRIFDHLFTTKGVGKGTGLGLAIARQIIVEKHGGSITVDSQPDQGTEFTILLPVTP